MSVLRLCRGARTTYRTYLLLNFMSNCKHEPGSKKEIKFLLVYEQIERILEKMERFGGSFVQDLVVLYRRADPVNQSKILRTWANYFDEYSTFVEDEDAVRVPIFYGFDHERSIGYVEISKESQALFPRFGLAAGFKKDKNGIELECFGFVQGPKTS